MAKGDCMYKENAYSVAAPASRFALTTIPRNPTGHEAQIHILATLAIPIFITHGATGIDPNDIDLA